MDLIFLRHGQTDWNVDGRLQGQTDVPLNETGEMGAVQAGEILKGYHIDVCYCSPLSRTRRTLELACPGITPVLDDRLKEWCFGPLEGQYMPWEFFREKWQLGQPKVEGLELIEEVIARVSDFYNEIKRKHPEQTVLVVSHGGVSGALYGAIYGVSEGQNLSSHCLPNTTPVLFREGQPPLIL